MEVLPFKGRACWSLDNTQSGNVTYEGVGILYFSFGDYVKAILILLVTISIISLNVLMVVVLHSKYHSKYLRELPKILMTSLAFTDLAVGTLVTPISFITMVYGCWPFSQTLCAIEALLISALFHESTLSLLCIAIERYICIIHPLQYHSVMTKKVCYAMVFLTWTLSFSFYSLLIYSNAETSYHFDYDGIMSCEPFYAKKYIIIAATALFYIPPAVILVYCYLTILKVTRKQIRNIQNSPPSIYSSIQGCESIRRLHVKEKMKTYRTLVTLGAMSAGFLIAVTPWTLTELISSVWELEIPSSFGFTVTWIAISNSFWNPILYGLLNKSFRNVSIEMISRLFCHRYLFGFRTNPSVTNSHE